jgi:hypothetical protein
MTGPVPEQRCYLLFDHSRAGTVSHVRDGKFTVVYDWDDPSRPARPSRVPRSRFTYPLRAWPRFGHGNPSVPERS